MSIKTRILIVSDTHGKDVPNLFSEVVDVAIHCGDLTEESKQEEFEAAIRLLKTVNAPLKLVIAGNHDWTLDTPTYMKKAEEVKAFITMDEIKRHYGDVGAARQLFETADAKAARIVFLDEGNHMFTLGNGARLTVFASPFSKSLDDWGGLGDWGFQYNPRHEEHDWAIGQDVDVVITHGPPEGIMDRTTTAKRAGSQSLFAAVARSRPKMHCFGHVHNNWGARMVTWRSAQPSDNPSHLTDIDNGRSRFIEQLVNLKPESVSMDIAKLEEYSRRRACLTSHSAETGNAMVRGMQTLFVNAAIQGTEEQPFHFPWVVDLDLPKA